MVDAPKTGFAEPKVEGAPKLEVFPKAPKVAVEDAEAVDAVEFVVLPKAEGVEVKEEVEPKAELDDEPKAPNAVVAGFPNAITGEGDGEGGAAGEDENAPKPPEKGDAFFSSAGVLGVTAAAPKTEVDPNVEGAPKPLLPKPPNAGTADLAAGVVEGVVENAPKPPVLAAGLTGVPNAEVGEDPKADGWPKGEVDPNADVVVVGGLRADPNDED